MRLTWIDAMKGFAMIGVVFGHVESSYKASGFFPEYEFLLQMIWDFGHSFRMPLFFLLSGYLYEMTWNERGHVSWEKIKNKFYDIAILYLLFAVSFWLIKFCTPYFSHRIVLAEPVTIQELILIPVQPFVHFWFLWVLAFLFLTVPCLVKMGWGKKWILGLYTVGYLIPWHEFTLWGVCQELYRNSFTAVFTSFWAVIFGQSTLKLLA